MLNNKLAGRTICVGGPPVRQPCFISWAARTGGRGGNLTPLFKVKGPCLPLPPSPHISIIMKTLRPQTEIHISTLMKL